jgi:hypothetical protein
VDLRIEGDDRVTAVLRFCCSEGARVTKGRHKTETITSTACPSS